MMFKLIGKRFTILLAALVMLLLILFLCLLSMPDGNAMDGYNDFGCNDSDGGKNYYVKGTVSGKHMGEGFFMQTDSCGHNLQTDQLLHEKVCIGKTNFTTIDYDCAGEGKDCLDGACVESKHIKFSVGLADGSVVLHADDEEATKTYINWARNNNLNEIFLWSNGSFLNEKTAKSYKTLKETLESQGFKVKMIICTQWMWGGSTRWEDFGIEPEDEGVACFNTDMLSGTKLEKIDRQFVADFEESMRIAAGIFDTIIIDDYFFLEHRCPRKKNNPDYAVEFMAEYSSKVVSIAKKVNPDVRVIFKMPAWIENYLGAGLDVERLLPVFDRFLIGTEAFGPPVPGKTNAYAWPTISFNNMLWFKSIVGSKFEGGGWIDTMHNEDLPEWMTPAAHQTVLSQADVVYVLGIGPKQDRMGDLITAEMNDYLALAELIKNKEMKGVLYGLPQQTLSGKPTVKATFDDDPYKEYYYCNAELMHKVPLLGIPLIANSNIADDGGSPLFFSAHNFKEEGFVKSFNNYVSQKRKILLSWELAEILERSGVDVGGENIVVLPKDPQNRESCQQHVDYLAFLPEKAIEPARNAMLSEFGFEMQSPNQVIVRLYGDDLIVLENINDGLEGRTGKIEAVLEFDSPIELSGKMSVPSGSGNRLSVVRKNRIFKAELEPLSLIVLEKKSVEP